MRARLILLVLFVAFSALLAEITLRIYNPIYVPLRANQIVLPVNNHFVMENTSNTKTDKIITNRYNSLGFRGPDLPEDFEDHLSIITVGGSTTASVALTDGKTWPDLVAQNLSKSIPNLWLNNAGFDGHSTFGHIQLLNQAIVDIKPDYILFLVGVNDVGRKDLNKYDAKQDIGNLSLKNKLVASSELLSTIQVVSRTLRAFELDANHHPGFDYRTIVKIVDTPPERVSELVALHLREFVPGYRSRLEALIEATITIGSKPILMTQPSLWGDERDPTLEVDLGLLKFNDDINVKTQGMIMDLYNNVTRSVAQDRNIPLIDLAESMPKDTQYYYDWMHYSNAGAEKVADLVTGELSPYLTRELASQNTAEN